MIKIRINGGEVKEDVRDQIIDLLKLDRNDVDGTWKSLILTDECLHDMAVMRVGYSTPRTEEATDEEIAEWKHFAELLKNFNFDEARKKFMFCYDTSYQW